MHRTVLTKRQSSALFDLPTDRTVMLRHYILADDDLEIILARRAHTRPRKGACRIVISSGVIQVQPYLQNGHR